MRGAVLVDTGPIVAYLSEREENHEWAVEQFNRFAAPLLTCEAVLTEAAHIVRRYGFDPSHVMSLVEAGTVGVRFNLGTEVGALKGLLEQYQDTPMDLADACLVRMAELYPSSRVMTLDRDFLVYRKERRAAIPLIMP